MLGTILLLIALGVIAAIVLTNLQKVRAIVESMKLFYSEVAFEMTKVVWPSQNEVVNSTIVVLVVTTVLTLGIMVVDFVLGHLVGLFITH